MERVNRDYDRESKDALGHKYAYTFDLDVMHPFMLRSFEPFFRPGSALELGSFRGDFTRRLAAHFTDITCVEASGEAIAAARAALGDRVRLVQGTSRRWRSVGRSTTSCSPTCWSISTIRSACWRGSIASGCPSRAACSWCVRTPTPPSRQIAVQMGLITHNAAVTPAEKEHGHRITYALDTLERDARAAGLSVVHRSGIFFKALANFQWDRLLATDIISPEYLEGCYQLGQRVSGPVLEHLPRL